MKNLVKFYREKHNLTQEQFAEKVGVTRQAISDIEREETTPGGDTMQIITAYISKLEGKKYCSEDIFLLNKQS